MTLEEKILKALSKALSLDYNTKIRLVVEK